MSIRLLPGGSKKKNKKRNKAETVFEPAVSFKRRMPWLLLILAGLFSILIARSFYLQVIDRKHLLELAQTQWRRTTVLTATRGEIVDCNGKELAQNLVVYRIVAWPQSVGAGDKERVASELARILDVDHKKLYEKLQSPTVREYVVKRQVDKSVADEVSALKLSGVGVLQDTKRYYPYGTMLSQTIGFTTIDGIGQSGLELSLDKYLTGRNGSYITETDNKGAILSDSVINRIEALNGHKLRLTIDTFFQSSLENALEEAVKINNAQNAQGIILDVDTGAIKAISTKPDFDLNSPPRSDMEALSSLSKNRVVTDVYEPGSTFKILTLAAALDSGSTALSSSFHCGGGYFVNGERIKCWRHAGHGSQDLTKATENSCNVCFMQLALGMGKETFYDYLYAFGLGQSTGSGLPGESSGIVTHQKYIKDNDLARIGFGQSIAVTPIQLASAVAAAVNGGELHTPYIVDEIVASDGTVVFKANTAPVRRVISEETSANVRRILQSVVDNGTGRNAKIEGYAVGGKTGTAQKYDKYGQVSSGSYICSFIGFAPADDPKYLCLILVDEPKVGSIFGSTVAAPFVRRVLSDILQYAGIPKNDINTSTSVIPNVTGMSTSEASEKLSEHGLLGIFECDGTVTMQVPAAGQSVPYGSSVLLYTGQEGINTDTDEPFYVSVPNLIGMTPLAAYDALKKVGLTMDPDPVDPFGVVVAQGVYAYESAPYGSSVKVYFGAAPTNSPTPAAAPTETPTPTETPAPEDTPQPEATPTVAP